MKTTTAATANPTVRTTTTTRTIVCVGMLAAISTILMLFEFPLPFIAPGFYGTNTAFVGEFANFVMGCAFVVPASVIYKRKKNRQHAMIGLAAGTVIMSAAAVFINALVLLPAYAKAFGMPVDAFVQMGTAINPAINGIWTFVLLAVAPFNLIKGVLVSVITVLLYKHISPILKGTR